jgi:uncharacterized membrane protein
MLEIGTRSVIATVASLGGATLLAYILYRRTSPTLPLSTRVLLGALRWAAAFIILLLVTDPTLRLMRTEHRKPVIAVLLDASRSMVYPDRADKMAKLNAALSDEAVNDLNGKGDVRFFTFADRVTELSAAEISGVEARGSRTDLVAGIRAVLDRVEAKPSAFVVFSDGGFNFGEDAVHFAGSLRVPVHSVSLAKVDPTPDISIDRVEASGLAYANTDVPVWINLSGRGTDGFETELSLSDSAGTLLTRPVSVPGAGATSRIMLSVDAGDIGVHRFRVHLTAFNGENVVANNSAAFTLKVVKGKVRVCLVAPAPSWDFAFARRCLEEAPNIEVMVMFTAPGTMHPRLPEMIQDLGRVLSDLDVLALLRGAELGPALEEVRQFVSGGGGILFLSGLDGAQAFGEMSPFTVSSAGQPRTALYAPVVADAGADHEIMTAEPGGAAGLWASLPPVPVDGVIAGLRDDSTVLLSGKSGAETLPLLAIRKYGAGRVVGFSAYDLWRWDFIPKGFGIESSPFSGLLLNSVGWLVEREETRHLSLSTSKSTYFWGEPVDIFARVTDENLKPLQGVLVEGEIREAASGDVIRSFGMSDRGGGSHSARTDLLDPGRYVVRAEARAADSLIGRGALEFTIDERGLEDLSFDGHEPLIRAVSAASGGMAYRIEETDDLLQAINPGTVVHRTYKELNFKLSLGSFLLLVGILGIEWLVRKRKLLI